ncbi:class I adenylate-forming enzyme family protein [Pedobacter sp. SYSU D00535]|uniref:AMP-binding protein n=1 Tax=Pedobacter sp. SYSU D00535 TaxID=2810308 RepID=UPI001A96FA66|nr:class I adenylate-forming enzyme family protein [Pedobacter sp. SYSU D00535]
MNFLHHIHKTLRSFPDKKLIYWGEEPGETSTGKALLNRVGSLAGHLKAKKVSKREKVLLLLPVNSELLSGLLALWTVGAIPVLPPAGSSIWDIAALVRAKGISKVLMAKPLPFYLKVATQLAGISILPTEGIETVEHTKLELEEVPATQAALISYSSGSTGIAKAIVRTHGVLSAQHQVLAACFPPDSNQVDFPLFPNILLHNLSLATVSVLPAIPGFSLENLDPAQVVEQIIGQKVTTLTGNFFYFKAILSHLQKTDTTLPLVQAIGIGGSPVPEFLCEALKRYIPRGRLFIIYGSSEAEPIAIREVTAIQTDVKAGYMVGTIHASIQLRVRAIGTVQSGADEIPVGEIEVKGAHVATNSGDWLSTGDFGYIKDGGLFLTGRKGNERIHRGIQHYQVEHFLLHFPNITDAAALSRRDGFDVIFTGTALEEEVKQELENQFPKGIFIRVKASSYIPKDKRHHSKILYSKLKNEV